MKDVYNKSYSNAVSTEIHLHVLVKSNLNPTLETIFNSVLCIRT